MSTKLLKQNPQVYRVCKPSQEGPSNMMSPLPMPAFGLFLLSLINNNNIHGPKLPPNESPKTFPRHYLQQTIENRP